MRSILAFVLAPLVTPLIFTALLAFDGSLLSFRGTFGMLEDALTGFLMIATFAYTATILLGVPAFFMYKRFQLHSVISYALGGVVIAVIAMVLITSITRGANFLNTSRTTTAFAFLKSLSVLVACGGLSGILFRLIAFSRVFSR